MPSTELLNAVVNGVTTGSIIALGAIGLALVYSIAEVPNFAHGELLTFGAYSAFLVNTPAAVPVFGVWAESGHTVATGSTLFLLTFSLYMGSRFLLTGREGLTSLPIRGLRDGSVGLVANIVLAAFLGVVVAYGAPSVWSGMLLAALSVGLLGLFLEILVFSKFREKGTDLATTLIVALGVAFFLRFSLQGVFGGGTRSYAVADTVEVGGFETSIAKTKFVDMYLSRKGGGFELVSSATGSTLWSVGFGIAAVVLVVGVAVLLLGSAYVLSKRRGYGRGTWTISTIGILGALVVAALFFSTGTSTREGFYSTRIRLSVLRILIVTVALSMMALLYYILSYTRLGKAMRAASDNLELAQVAGIDTRYVMRATWLIAGVYAGVGGVLLGVLIPSVTVTLGFDLLLPMFAAVILGGVGSIYGAILGSYLVGLTMDVGVYLIPGIGPEYRVALAFAVLFLVLLVKPEGIRGGVT
ncbi:MAG: branched-chain amino acid ABC transporter permease [Halobacteria archaeon]